MGESTNNTQSIADYLAQLLKDRKQLAAFPNVFLHVERLLDEEIVKVRSNLFQINGIAKQPLELPEPQGPVVTLSEKVYVPIKEHPDFNFVGRILGPRGMTAKQLEQETGCKIMVRGRGSMRDKKKEEQNRGKPNWEHLSDELHVLITVEDSENRAAAKLQRAVDEIKKLLVPSADGEDELKKRQLMELAIINGTYRDSSKPPSESLSLSAGLPSSAADAAPRLQLTQMASLGGLMTSQIRTPATLGAPLILSPRMAAGTALINSAPPPLISAGDAALLYAQYAPDYAAQYAAQLAQPLHLADYSADPTGAGSGAKQRRVLTPQGREHPYQRPGAPPVAQL
ncbi:protein held out wings-like isoform X1 [Amphibalanus amphitrite]|uniref:protein held out wings-like isoform X1 n=1 Tax=Amphibalanus amphitrite TaxID=1232801 RepID=UPI001C909123|nr:protein held out wings-like isoform X1 [Amphibalanus amphitrite]XP_043213585.1 protein held out wings-like isoform X1 [Amphibalanus amphitrite]